MGAPGESHFSRWSAQRDGLPRSPARVGIGVELAIAVSLQLLPVTRHAIALPLARLTT
eukprot:NODE_10723_length_298_cov_45.736626.p3 GENE.NODE_10723_length_298_cov_45.736626~~NODE_10723_length_298_cov_45.736626.p3  ORF type:complete len:58 (-),score=1.16 NODE_10723_length_298_cov_45.736626:107-280(-)